MTPPPQLRSTRRRMLETLTAIVILMLAPLIPSLIALAIALPLGCNLNEAGTSSCVIFGTDFGEALTVLALMGFVLVFTVPLGLIFLVIWCIAAVVLFIRWKKTRS